MKIRHTYRHCNKFGQEISREEFVYDSLAQYQANVDLIVGSDYKLAKVKIGSQEILSLQYISENGIHTIVCDIVE